MSKGVSQHPKLPRTHQPAGSQAAAGFSMVHASSANQIAKTWKSEEATGSSASCYYAPDPTYILAINVIESSFGFTCPPPNFV